MCVKLYGSRKVCDVSELQALLVQKNARPQEHHHDRPWWWSCKAVTVRTNAIDSHSRKFILFGADTLAGAQERDQPSASRHSARVRRRQVNIGVSRSVKPLALVS